MCTCAGGWSATTRRLPQPSTPPPAFTSASGTRGLLRKPLKGGWQAQGAPGYRTASALLGDRSAVLADPDGALDAIVRRHLSGYGPASRHDIAWWSGLGLRVVDAALARLAGQTTGQQGPDGRIYHDLLDVLAATDPPDLRLLPEFDALLCGYDPKARDRFVSPKHYRRLWYASDDSSGRAAVKQVVCGDKTQVAKSGPVLTHVDEMALKAPRPCPLRDRPTSVA